MFTRRCHFAQHKRSHPVSDSTTQTQYGGTAHCRYKMAPEDPRAVEWRRNVTAHAQKPDSVFQRNGRVHLYRRGCQFSRVLAFLECRSGKNDCSNTGWTVPSQTEACLATHSIRLFPLHFSSRASPCATRFRFHSTWIPPFRRRMLPQSSGWFK